MMHPQVIVQVLNRSQITNATAKVTSKRISTLALIIGKALMKLRECRASETAIAPLLSEDCLLN